MNQQPDFEAPCPSPPPQLGTHEVALLEEMDKAGIVVRGLVLRRDENERTFVDRFDPNAADVADRQAQFSLNQLDEYGQELFRQGGFEKAEAAFRLQWRLASLQLGSEHPRALTSANNFAEAARARGDAKRAQQVHEWVNEVRRRVLGPAHRETLISANNLAEAFRAGGRLQKAHEIQAGVHQAMVATMGPEHPETLVAASNLASVLRGLDHLAEARQIEEATVAALTRVLGPEHLHTIAVAHNLASTLVAQGHRRDAAELLSKVLDARARVLGTEHPDTLTAASNLANLLHLQGDLGGARTLQEQVYDSRLRVLGPDHPDTLVAMSNLAETVRAQGDHRGALRLHRLDHEACQRIHGSEHPATLVSAGNLGMTLGALGRHEEARELHEWVYRQRERQFGPDHMQTLMAAGSLASTLDAQGEWEASISLQRRVLAAFQRQLGHEHPSTQLAASNLAAFLVARGDLAGARVLQEEVLDVQRKVLGPAHPESLTSASNLALTLFEQGELRACGDLAIELLRTLVSSGAAGDVAFHIGGNIPMLSAPQRDWPDDVTAALAELLPDLARTLVQGLEFLPHESWRQPYAQFERMHRQWLGWASHHAPEQMLQALSGLHGIRSWSSVQADLAQIEEAARHEPGPRSAASQGYLHARSALNDVRQRLVDLQLHEPKSGQLSALVQAERDAARQRERAEAELARVAPELAIGVSAGRGLQMQDLLDFLQDGDAWVAFLPAEHAFAYVIRSGGDAYCLPLGDIAGFRHACQLHTEASRHLERGLLRDSMVGFISADRASSPPADDAQPGPSLAELGEMARRAFWSPLEEALDGVRRIHLVTGPGFHDLMLEFATPSGLGPIQLLRYCGLPAFQRRIMRDLLAPVEAIDREPWLVLADDDLHAEHPIPFTRLDALLLRHRELTRPIDAETLLRPDAAAVPVRLFVSTHGQSVAAGDLQDGASQGGASGGGFMLLPGDVLLKPTLLAASGSRIELMISLNCWGGRAGDGEHGEALGTMSALQRLGMRAAIGCLAPVSDFYTPLLSAFIWHEIFQGHDAGAALQRARERLIHGPWDNYLPDLQLLRQGYLELMLQLLRLALHRAGDESHNRTARKIVVGIWNWSLPASWRRRLQPLALCSQALLNPDTPLGFKQRVHAAVDALLPQSDEEQISFVQACLDVLLRQPHQRDPIDLDEDGRVLQSIEKVCALTVSFGDWR